LFHSIQPKTMKNSLKLYTLTVYTMCVSVGLSNLFIIVRLRILINIHMSFKGFIHVLGFIFK
jgi:hypothetical protein